MHSSLEVLFAIDLLVLLDLVFGYFLFLIKLCKVGNRYANVLPVPVGAVTSTFLSSNNAGMVCICTAVGLLTPNIANPCSSFSSTEYLLIRS